MDGLNTAVHRWMRRTIAGAAGGTGENIDAYRRKLFNVKIDHHFNPNHRLTGSLTQERRYSDNMPLVSPWPTGYSGEIRENPTVISGQLTSTLSPSLLNEFRYGYRVTTLHYIPGFHASPRPGRPGRLFFFFFFFFFFFAPGRPCGGPSGEQAVFKPSTVWPPTVAGPSNAFARGICQLTWS